MLNAKDTRSRPGPTSRCWFPRSSRMRTWPSTCPRRSSGIRRVGSNLTEIKSRKSIYWLYQCVRRAERQLPVAPDTFDGEIVHKHATNGSDVDFLKKKFRQTFWAVMGPAKNIQLLNVPGPTPARWLLFLEVTLCECSRLVRLNLSRNEAITDATLQPFAALHDSLECLDVGTSAGFGAASNRSATSTNCATCACSVALHWRAADGGSGGLLRAWLEDSTSFPRCHNSCSSTLAIRSVTRRPSCRSASGFCSSQRPRWLRNREARYRIQTPLWSAADGGRVETAGRLLAGRNGLGGVEVDWANASLGGTPLLQAADQNFPEVVKVLLEHRADANKGKNDGFTPLLFACAKWLRPGGHVAACKGAPT